MGSCSVNRLLGSARWRRSPPLSRQCQRGLRQHAASVPISAPRRASSMTQRVPGVNQFIETVRATASGCMLIYSRLPSQVMRDQFC